MQHPTPYLFFPGTCKEAFEFYAKALNGKIGAMMKNSEAPPADQANMGNPDHVMHASLEIPGAGMLMASDSPPQYYSKPQGFAVSLHPADATEAERVFAALSKDGTVTMPMAETFWAQRFGMCTDRFGIPWMVNCSRPC